MAVDQAFIDFRLASRRRSNRDCAGNAEGADFHPPGLFQDKLT
jgi:hypothetical protein